MATCDGCGAKTSSYLRLCRTCKSAKHHAYKRIEAEGIIVARAGVDWWVWDRRGFVLVQAQPSKLAAVLAVARLES